MKIDKMHFTKTEVETALENLPLGKAKGPDGIGNLPIKRTARSLSVSLNRTTDIQRQTAQTRYPSSIALS